MYAVYVIPWVLNIVYIHQPEFFNMYMQVTQKPKLKPVAPILELG